MKVEKTTTGNSGQVEPLVIPQKHTFTSNSGIGINFYHIQKDLKFDDYLRPLFIMIYIICLISFGISLYMFLSV